MNLSIDFSLQPLIPFPDTELLETVTWSWDAQTGYGPANVDEVPKSRLCLTRPHSVAHKSAPTKLISW